jgi:uncharacterized repeat protein (TIGR01451 family)
VVLGDVDGDGDLDVFFGNDWGQANKVWLNNNRADLAIIKQQEIDDQSAIITYTLIFSNIGPQVAKNVVITDIVPTGVTNLSVVTSGSGLSLIQIPNVTYSWQAPEIAVNAIGFITITGTIIDGPTIVNTANIMATASGDLVTDNNQAQVSFTSQADLAINKQQVVDDQTATITYTLTFSNNGPHVAQNVIIEDIVPPKVTNLNVVTSDNGTSFTQIPGFTYRWQAPLMPVNSTGYITITGTLIDGQTVINTATINTTTSVDTDTDNNQAQVSFDPLFLQVIATDPAGNGRVITRSGIISATFNRAINNNTVDSSTFTVRGEQTGVYTGSYTFGSVYFDAANDFKTGEKIVVNLNSGIKAPDGKPLQPYAWQFWAAVEGGSGHYSLKQSLGGSSSFEVALGDLDQDGDIDAFVANAGALDPGGGQPNRVWENNGGTFIGDSSSGHNLGSEASTGVALGDLNGDGPLDAFVANWGQKNEVWLNDGTSSFSHSSDPGHNLGDDAFSRAVALADLNADGHLDAFVANEGEANTVWFNAGDGTGHFSLGQNLPGSAESWDVAVGDINGDGYLDAVVVNEGQFNELWLNNGAGQFNLNQSFGGNAPSRAVTLADVDGDGDLDALVANGLGLGQPNKVWRNDDGIFNSDQSLGNANSWAVALGDVDADNDLDAIFGNLDANRVWLNNGGTFSDSDQSLGDSTSFGLALGDVDDSKVLAIFVANGNNQANTVWLNGKDSGSTRVYLPVILKPDPSALTDLYIKSINTNGITWVTIRDPNNGNAVLLSCSSIGNNVTQFCGSFVSVGTYNVTAQTNKCGLLGPVTFHDAQGGKVIRSVHCN